MIKNSLTVTIGSFVSLILNFTSQMIIAATFGSGIQMDSYLTAIVVPAYITNLLISGGLTFVLIPAFTEQKKISEQKAWELLGSILFIVIFFLILLSICGFIFAPNIITISAPGFNGIKKELAIKMLRVLIFTIPFSGIYSIAFNIQTIYGKYLLPALSSGVGAFANLIFIISLKGILGAYVLPWGQFIFIFTQSLMVSIPIFSHKWKNLLSFRDKQIINIFKSLGPLVLIGIFSQLVPVIERYFSSKLTDGDLSNYGYATKIASIFYSLIGSGLALSVFPEIADKYYSGSDQEFKHTIIYGIRLTFALTLPLILLVIIFRTEIVKIIYERGVFSNKSTLIVSSLLPLLLISVLFQMMSNIFTRIFFVIKNTLTPSIVSLFVIIIYIIIIPFLVNRYGIFGLVIGGSTRWALFTITLVILLAKTIGIRDLVSWVGKYLFLSIITALIIFALSYAFHNFDPLALICLTSILCLLFYSFFLYFLDKKMFLDLQKILVRLFTKIRKNPVRIER